MAKSKDQVKAARKSRRTKNKAENATLKKSRNWYPVTDSKKRFVRKCKAPKAGSSNKIAPGTVLILLAGRFRGRRVVFLKSLKSGLLLVTGPYNLNGVPLRRVNRAYTIPTKTSVKLGNSSHWDKIDDDFFKKVNLIARNDYGAVIMPKDDKEKSARVVQARKDAQKNVDTEVRKAVQETPLLKEYLRNRFALKNGQQVHNLVY